MKFSTTILGAALLTTSVIATPFTERRAARHAARANHTGRPASKLDTLELASPGGTSDTEYSTNWSGAVLHGTGYTSVTGEFTVPKPKLPSGTSPSEKTCASAWVGIDGDTCNSAILQTGVNFCIQGDEVSYGAWYEWYPDFTYDFSDFQISTGDVIKLTVTATSKNSGSAVVDNVTTGKSVTHKFAGVDHDGDLCETNAEWIVEDFMTGGKLVPLTDFGTVTFSKAEAISGGKTVGPSGATLFNIKKTQGVLTKSSITRDSVTVSRV
ncbi:hypothetical protein N7537_000997 [Penicillium hordei]|uniref:Aspergillopepsin-2 n=1 Tax=Penicillium hordei TaxID=40994 RepID=A0AAD6H6K0_9EURO|nr:uncharacterized protein N7537_000997 [Penicillium hordei]KAJ5615883.1 hypothetical protein N7537_000997 [Penicillium hordei]